MTTAQVYESVRTTGEPIEIVAPSGKTYRIESRPTAVVVYAVTRKVIGNMNGNLHGITGQIVDTDLKPVGRADSVAALETLIV